MAARGLVRVRLLDEMRRPLPVEDVTRAAADPLPVRPFRPGADDAGFLRVNNRAFTWHPDQSGWDAERLHRALAEPWVDLDGFLVHDGEDGRIAGCCWTRVHPGDGGRPAVGEIYVIAADPDRHGTGLGRALVLAGLDHLAKEGLGTAMLYVESDNAPAIRLYERLGFTVHHSDAAYAP
jgi:mycothiol synthase